MKYFFRIYIYFILLLLYGSYATVAAQSKFLKGKIIDEITGREVDYGLVLNYSKNVTIYSNKAGEFSLEANEGDTLVMSAMGYYYQKVIVTDSLLNAVLPVQFVMRPQVYELREARIYALGSYDDFRRQFIRLNKPKTENEALAQKLADLSHDAAKESYNTARANQKLGGITFFSIPIRSPEEKERIRLAAILEKEKRSNRIYQKFNPEVVKKVTGLTDERDIIEFMVFCKFSDTYLLNVNEYDLMAEIAHRFEAFRRKKQGMNTGEYPDNPTQDPFPHA